MEDQDRLISTQEVADRLGISLPTLYRYRMHGAGPPSYRVGGLVKYRVSEVDAWIEAQAEAHTATAGGK